ncbi:MAG: hypothetical protein ING37_05200 [Rhodocyclaceae bacterium]|nr:hypothetical protein [Rhodocyclaceae bacterium]MCA3039984.1 hypothetical protein [Rhodocyclaceae bacterium]
MLESIILANVSYVSYLGISIAMTIWVARVLSKNGEMFLVKCFGQDQELAKSTNHLLVIGFYLVNIGFICARLDSWYINSVDLVPAVGAKVGTSVLVLGLMHFFNMIMIAKFGKAVSGWVRTNEFESAEDAALLAKAAE